MTRYATVEDKWNANVEAAEGGHMLWTGALSGSGTPVIDLRRKRYQAVRVAYQIRHGRDPEGVVRVSCGVALCVAPAHVRDTADRQREHQLLRVLYRRAPAPTTCPAGHDQDQHGRFDNQGHAYCNTCNQAAAHKSRPAGAPRKRNRVPA